MGLRIDSHHHLWRYTPAEFGWLDGELASLKRDFLLDEFQQEMRGAGVQGCVAVQARQSIQETDWLLELAEDTSEILGVVGWADIADAGFPDVLGRLRQHSHLKGLRHGVQGEPQGFLDGDAFDRGIVEITAAGLVYDLLVTESQLAEVIRFVDRHPNQKFVLDHIGKPCIRNNSFDHWSREIRALALRGNVMCKLSGMVTEADPLHWTPQQLTPYFDIVLEAFKPDCLMAGSDWPVVLAACSYDVWWQTIEEWVRPLTLHEQERILGVTAISTYQLQAESKSSD